MDRGKSWANRMISIHALREEGDLAVSSSLSVSMYFYPRPPRGGRQLHAVQSLCQNLISIHALREEGDQCGRFVQADGRISIHALREEGDSTGAVLAALFFISIHALREEGDPCSRSARRPRPSFLSTPSARRATAKTERKPSAFVSLYTSLHKLQRGVCKASHKITPLLVQTAVIPVRSVPENHVRFLFALAGHHPDIKRSAHYPAQTPGAVQRARPWSGNCCPAGRTADCPRQGQSGRSALP